MDTTLEVDCLGTDAVQFRTQGGIAKVLYVSPKDLGLYLVDSHSYDGGDLPNLKTLNPLTKPVRIDCVSHGGEPGNLAIYDGHSQIRSLPNTHINDKEFNYRGDFVTKDVILLGDDPNDLGKRSSLCAALQKIKDISQRVDGNSEKLNQQELSLGELAKRLNDSLSGIQSSINTILTSIQDLDKKVASMEQRVKKTIQLHGADREQEKWTFVATENTQDGRPALEIRCNDTLSGRFFANALSRNPIINPTINPPIVTPAMAALCNQDNNQPILSKTLPPVEPLNKGSDSIEKSSPERVTSPNRVGNFSISMNTPGKKQKKSATSSSSSSSFRPLGSTIVESIAVPKP